jgi:hypothetical protein
MHQPTILQVKFGLLTYEHLISRELQAQQFDDETEGIHSDRRLTMFGYTHDMFGMIIVPMIRDQLVYLLLLCVCVCVGQSKQVEQ